MVATVAIARCLDVLPTEQRLVHAVRAKPVTIGDRVKNGSPERRELSQRSVSFGDQRQLVGFIAGRRSPSMAGRMIGD